MLQKTSKRATIASVSLIALAGATAGAVAMATAEAQDNRTASTNQAVVPVAAPSFADLIEHVSPAVVSVDVRTEVAGGAAGLTPEDLPPGLREFFERFGGELPSQQQQPQPREAQGAGSGFFISEDGLIVTNYHVVENANSISVSLKDGRELDAEVVGSDPDTDLALIRVEGDGFPYVEFARDPDYRVGDWVVAMGNPYGLGGTATAGIISAIGRDEELGARYNGFIQIDAPINRGNSGGPTFDINGNVIGVNSQIFSPTGGNIGIGFAIPSNVAADVVQQLAESGSVQRGWLGVVIRDVTEELAEAFGADQEAGALVEDVTVGSPAEDAGFQVGDIIVAVNGDDVDDRIDLTRQVGAIRPGEDVRFTVLRDGRERTVNVEIGLRPSEEELNQSQQPQQSGPQADETPGGAQASFGLRLSSLDAQTRQALGLDDDVQGVVVMDAASDGLAAERGLQQGDVILQVGGEPVSSASEFSAAVDSERESGKGAVALRVQRDGVASFVALPLDDESDSD